MSLFEFDPDLLYHEHVISFSFGTLTGQFPETASGDKHLFMDIIRHR
jgi:hypothetical protein